MILFHLRAKILVWKEKLLELSKKTVTRYGQLGFFQLNGKTIKTPILWLGQQIGGIPLPWREGVSVEGMMVNAFETFANSNILNLVRERGIHEFLKFKGPVFMDSGGFMLMKRSGSSVTPLEVLQLYKDARCDMGAVLDHPLDPMLSVDPNNKRWETTLINTSIMFQNRNELTLVPIVHGHSRNKLRKSCEQVKDIVGDVSIIAIGSLVPLIRMKVLNGRFAQSSFRRLVDCIQIVREMFPNAFMHVFGIGGASTMHLLFSLRVDSADSLSWRIKAGHGAIQLPGRGDRFLSDHGPKRRVIDKADKALLDQCKCPICAGKDVSHKIKVLDRNYQDRAVHNAWVLLEEVRQFRQNLKRDFPVIEDFLKSRLVNSAFWSLFRYAHEGNHFGIQK